MDRHDKDINVEIFFKCVAGKESKNKNVEL